MAMNIGQPENYKKFLNIKDWRNFNKVIDKAIISSNNSYPNQNLWGVEVTTPISSGKGKVEIAKDYKLSRYACYLIAQKGNPRKKSKKIRKRKKSNKLNNNQKEGLNELL